MVKMRITFAFLLPPHRHQRPRRSCPPPAIACQKTFFLRKKEHFCPIFSMRKPQNIFSPIFLHKTIFCAKHAYVWNLHLPQLSNLPCIQALPVVEVLEFFQLQTILVLEGGCVPYKCVLCRASFC